jgi:Vitamin K-dependent gamma-carboxylase
MNFAALARRWNTFWFESDVLVVRLTTFRVAFFGLLGFDLWLLMVPHAQRHGFGEFNVSHVPVLDAFLPRPSAAVITAAYLFMGFLSLRVALGIALRGSLVALAVLYNATYYWSQVDSYQHHYLIGLLLILCCFLPFGATPGVDQAATPPLSQRTGSWAARLIYLQVSIVYFYTATTKVTHYWLDGWALDRIIEVPWVRAAYASAGDALGLGAQGPYAFVAHVIMLWQFFVAVAFLSERLRPIACITGPIFHALVEVIDLKIGWFSYYMIATYYILLFPDAWFLALGRPLGRVLAPLRGAFSWLIARAGREDSMLVVTTALACGALALLSPLPGSALLAALVGAAAALGSSRVLAADAPRPVPRALLQVGIVVLMAACMRFSDVPYDYYRFWGYELRGRGQLEAAAKMYELANDNARGGATRHVQLAEIYRELGRPQAAQRAYERALAFEGQRERALRGIEELRVAR